MTTSVSKRTRGVTWTLFNYEPYLDQLKQYAKDECEYMIFGFEICPDTGKRHLQGYHYYSNARAYPNKGWRKVTNLETNGRDFISNGSPQSNYDYCSKLGDFWQFGELPKQGARTDWTQALNDLQAGGDILTAVANQPQLLPCIRALITYKQMTQQSIHRNVQVIVLVGPTGSGKSKWAWDNFPDLYNKPDGSWWDGYTGQETILLDDYYGDTPYPQLLKILDRYPLQLPVKGGFIPARYTRVIITSNDVIGLWYSKPGAPPMSIAALIRRVNSYYLNSIPDAIQIQEDLQASQEGSPQAGGQGTPDHGS